MACLDDQTVLDLVEGRLPPESRAAAAEHADSCPSCRELIASMTNALVEASEPLPEPARPAALVPGSRLGRYRILDLVGAGGMGVVYSAYDPELDRRVALKLVRAAVGPDAETLRARLQREARAIARITHPNVVAVHDVGTLDEQVFIAMEFVDGVTLKAWVERPMVERLEVLVQAGRGLSAAHHAGLVHRDFKPDNVLVGRDGRVRVTDFGLARPPGGELASGSPLQSPDVTQTGAMVGTPAYMPPEQMLGEPIDPRSDVFSFCVAAWECLYGRRPFQGGTAEELLDAIRHGRVKEPPSAEVPARARRALLRGLNPSPAQRPPLDSVLDQLVPRKPARNRLLVAAAALALLALPLLGWRAFQRERDRSLCAAGSAQLAGVWDGPRRQFLEPALESGDIAMVRGVESALDDYARRWSSDYNTACQATRLEGQQPREVLDLRMACLDQRRRELDAFVNALHDAPDRLASAAMMVHQFVPISECDDVSALKATVHPKIPQKQIDEMGTRLAKLNATRFVGDADAEGKEAIALAEAANQAGALDIAAGAVAIHAATLSSRAQFDAAIERLNEAGMLAAIAHDDKLLAHILVRTIIVQGVTRAHFGEAFRTASYAKSIVARLGGNPLAEWELLNAISQVEWRAERLADAETHSREALAWFERTGSSNPLDHAQILLALANVLGDSGKIEEAQPFNERAYALFRAALGPNHPQTLVVDTDLSVDFLELGRATERVPRQREIVETLRKRGKNTEYCNAIAILGWLQLDSSPLDAERSFRESLKWFAEIVPADYVDQSLPLTGLGAAAVALGHPKTALPQLERALALQSAPELRESTDRAETELFLALALGSGARSNVLATHARDVLKAKPLSLRRARLVADAEKFLARP